MSLLANSFSNKNKQIWDLQEGGVSYNFVRGLCLCWDFVFLPNPIIEGNGKDRVEMNEEKKGEVIVLFF